jgi:hypothetical protein
MKRGDLLRVIRGLHRGRLGIMVTVGFDGRIIVHLLIFDAVVDPVTGFYAVTQFENLQEDFDAFDLELESVVQEHWTPEEIAQLTQITPPNWWGLLGSIRVEDGR